MSETLRPAQPELVALAVAVRDDWRAADVQAVLVVAHTAGWTWARALTEMVRLVVTKDAEPRDLLEAVRDPRNRPARTGTTPGPEYLAVKNRMGGHDDAA
jgi:hypothetical protein